METPQLQRDKTMMPLMLVIVVLVVVSLALSAWTGGTCL
jgi:hypothetical protein